jgi:serine/threonine-protein kinase
MRWVRGTDLKTLIRDEGPLSPARTVEIIAQVAGALDEAHAEGLVHRDVKPGNVLIAAGRGTESPGHVYLSDFGVTKRAASDSGITATGQFVGTLDYAAPEQITGGALDGRTDVYSLGCVLYECLTGEAPFVRDAEMAVLWAHVHQPPPKVTDKRPELSPEIDGVLARAMAKSPDDRYPTAGALAAEARGALGVGTGERPALVPTRRRFGTVSAAGGLAGVVAIVAVVAVVLTRSGGTSVAPPASPAAKPVDSVWRIDPGTGRVLAKIPTGTDPGSVAIGEGSVWVTNYTSNTVSRIDPVTNRAVTIRVGRGPYGVAIGQGSAWVVNKLGRSVSRIDPSSNRVVGTFSLEQQPWSVAVDDDGVWVGLVVPGAPTGTAAVARLDPDSGSLVTTIPVTGQPTNYVTLGEGSVWSVTDAGQVTQIDPATDRIVGTLSLERQGVGIVVGDGSVWVQGNGVAGVVYQIDPANVSVVATIAAGGNREGGLFANAGLAEGNGKLWVVDSTDDALIGIATVSGQVVSRVSVGPVPSAVAVGAGAVWVTIDASST